MDLVWILTQCTKMGSLAIFIFLSSACTCPVRPSFILPALDPTFKLLNINSHSRDIQHLNHLVTRTLTTFVSVLYSSLGQLLYYLFCYRLSVNSLLYQFLFAFLFTQRFCRQTAHQLVLQIHFIFVCFLC